MDHALVQTGSIVAAGAVVLENSVIESGWIWAGVPAKPVKKVSEELLKGQIDRIADNYTMYAGWLKD
jgi:carbonic anhydrase/acetyltransferase-like protein (isoleucine patch superfamily)